MAAPTTAVRVPASTSDLHSYDLVLDQWSYLAHKAPLAGRRNNWLAPTWVGDEGRRLTAYILLAAYRHNAARYLLNRTQDAKDEHVELGDADLAVSRAVDALVGEEQQVVVDGAADFVEELPDDATPADVTANEAARVLAEREEWLREWADDAGLMLDVLKAEGHAVGLGDGVYHLAWSNRSKRPTVTVYDPGFYFPVLDDGADEYPRKVHLAWEFCDPDGKRWVRRVTFELVTVEPRRYRWTPPGETSTETCVMTNATFELGNQGRDVDDLVNPASIEINEDGLLVDRLDLGIDFIPVIHVPNTPDADHYGTSILARVAQILDELADTDSDLSKAAANSGAPPLVVSGMLPGGGAASSASPGAAMVGQPQFSAGSVATYGPGTAYFVGQGGSLSQLDTSKNLDALLKYMGALLDRLSVNGQLPAEVLGRVKASDVASGVLFSLTFGPLTALVTRMRLVRTRKYRLLLKMVQRLAQQGGVLDAGETPRAELVFGSFMPTDRASVIAEVSSMRKEQLISRESAVARLVAEGILDVDVAEEVKRIDERDFAGAKALADALGDEAPAYALLGLEPPAALPTAPEPPPPPLPGQQTGGELPPGLQG